MIKEITIIVAALIAQTKIQAFDLDSRVTEKSNIDISNPECSKKSEGVFCINGVISSQTVDKVENIKKLSRVIINSEGGDADSAMIIGRKIFNDGATLEVQSKCISACANYLVPAARYLELNKNSFIVIHGAVARGINEYKFIIDKKNNKEFSESEIISNFNKVRNGILRRENEYFDYILKDDAFVTRYREQVRDLLLSKKISCKYYKEFFVILDQQYLLQFGINVTRWPNQSDRQMFDIARFSFPGTNIIYGINSNYVRLLNPIGTNCTYSESSTLKNKVDTPTYDEKEIF
jgi:hypothetical protein